MASHAPAEQLSAERTPRDPAYIRSLASAVLHELVPWAADFCEFEITTETRVEAAEDNLRRMGMHPGGTVNPMIINTAEYLRH